MSFVWPRLAPINHPLVNVKCQTDKKLFQWLFFIVSSAKYLEYYHSISRMFFFLFPLKSSSCWANKNSIFHLVFTHALQQIVGTPKLVPRVSMIFLYSMYLHYWSSRHYKSSFLIGPLMVFQSTKFSTLTLPWAVIHRCQMKQLCAFYCWLQLRCLYPIHSFADSRLGTWWF